MKNWVLLILFCFCSTVVAEDNPLHVAIVFDDSGSMDTRMSGGSRIEVAKKALTSVVEQLPNDTHVGIVLLNGDWKNWAVPIGKVNKPEMINTINHLRTRGGTPLGGCTDAAAKRLLELKTKKPYSRYRLLIVTDGEASDGNLINQCVPEIIQKGIAIDTIGLDMAQGHSLATKVNNYRAAQDVETLTKAILQTFAEINSDNPDFAMLEGFPDDLAFKIVPEIARFDVKAEAEKASNVGSSAAPAATSSAVTGWSIFKIILLGVVLLVVVGAIFAFFNS